MILIDRSNNMTELTIQEVANNTKYEPLIIHINPLGLFRMGDSNKERFLHLNIVLNKIQKNGGNIATPAYSYSYTKNEIYDIKNTHSSLDEISEYLRKNNKIKRTIDPNFSYVLFGNGFSNRHLVMSDYSSFGEGSLIDEVFNKDGYLGAIGGALEYLTEVHFLERKLNVAYRFDKVFKGISIGNNGKNNNNKVTYFCRDYSYLPSFIKLKKDLLSSGLVSVWKITDLNLQIEVVKIQELYLFIKEKLEFNSEYLLDK
jgi:aminoglycoside N3'-acetyltransferase